MGTSQISIDKAVELIVASLPVANPNRVREMTTSRKEEEWDAIRKKLNSGKAKYEVRYMFNQDAGLNYAHIRRVK